MKIKRMESISLIHKQYETGEKPVLIRCNDKRAYICKYKYSKVAGYKLVCEYLGSLLARKFEINAPSIALVDLKSRHIPYGIHSLIDPYLPLLGSRKNNNATDINANTINQIPKSYELFEQLLKIALFDCWVANEDRNYNNLNMMYDIEKNLFVPIDYGCIFNTATFEYKISLLTETESIIASSLFNHLKSEVHQMEIYNLFQTLHCYFVESIEKCKNTIFKSIKSIPAEWDVSNGLIHNKLEELFRTAWTEKVWDNFVDIVNSKLY